MAAIWKAKNLNFRSNEKDMLKLCSNKGKWCPLIDYMRLGISKMNWIQGLIYLIPKKDKMFALTEISVVIEIFISPCTFLI